jgi:flagellar hook-associated protein 3 FlgL
MRTSLSLQVQNSLVNIARAADGLTEAQSRAATGKRILKPSDDVPGTDRALSLRSAINTVDQLADNSLVSKPALQTADAALNDVTNAITSVQNIAIAAANGSITDAVRTDYLKQLDDIMTGLADTANTRSMDQFVFSGTATNQPAVTAQAGTPPYAYTGDSGVKKAQVLSWVSVPTNIPGSKVFNFDGSAGAGTTDVFTMIKRVHDAIAAGDTTALSSELTNVNANLDNVLSCRSRIGSWMQRMDSAQSVLSDTKLRMQELLSNVEDADLPSAVIQLQTQENVYQAALSVSSRMLNMSLATVQLSTG